METQAITESGKDSAAAAAEAAVPVVAQDRAAASADTAVSCSSTRRSALKHSDLSVAAEPAERAAASADTAAPRPHAPCHAAVCTGRRNLKHSDRPVLRCRGNGSGGGCPPRAPRLRAAVMRWRARLGWLGWDDSDGMTRMGWLGWDDSDGMARMGWLGWDGSDGMGPMGWVR